MSAKRWVWVGAGVLVAGALVWRLRTTTTAAAGAPAAGGGRAANADRVIPVVAVPVEQRDVPIWLEGLGSVTPLKTITIKSQVDGRLDQVLFKEGQWVKKGTVLAQVDPRPFMVLLHQAEASLARDEAQLKNGNLNLSRYKTLRQQNMIAQQQLDDQQATVNGVDAAILADRAQFENARLQLDYARITSPIDGVTGVRLVDPGNVIHASDPGGIVVVTQIDPMAILFTLPQDDLARVAKAAAAGTVPVEAWSRDGGERLGQGELLVIDNQVNQSTSTIKIKASFPNPAQTLWPNAFVKARVLVSTERGALVVPTAAVQRGPHGAFVYVVADGAGDVKRAAMRPIEVRSTGDSITVVAKGLTVADKVVTDGQDQLKPDAKIAPRPPENVAERAKP
jgi:multidrug efflux system membrane fusion protein